ncbi:MAG: glycogen debranching protein GlgX [Kineosporiaceae bacterium]
MPTDVPTDAPTDVPTDVPIPVDSALPGRPFPLGATPVDGGTNVAVVSEIADGVQVCLVTADGGETRLDLLEYDAGVWHGFVPGMAAGDRYGFRVGGPYDPSRGLRCNPAKLLLDPYAKAIAGDVAWDQRIFGYSLDKGPDAADGRDDSDSASAMPRSVVVDPAFDWSGDVPPSTSYADTVIYEVHVKGFTATHPDIPPELRGTYAGLAHPAAIGHLRRLGVTAVELLPVHQSVTNGYLRDRGLVNYWGYDTIGFFAPHAAYSAAARAGRVGGQVDEFKTMVRALHAAGLEVILDVVYNHTVEGDQFGPTLCHRGLDNPAYYRLVPDDPRRYYDTTGTGNALNVAHTTTLRMIVDSLRYWVMHMHVDGFRFDLAATLGREAGGFASTSAFFDLVDQDPVLSQVKLIAEPWDVGQADSYDLGRFPPLWSEWNGRFRDTARDFWRSVDGTLSDFATRISGSRDLYGGTRRRPSASVNLVTTHDGFTLRDLVSYGTKHNDANGEDGRDGSDDNRSWNCGAEGPTDDPDVNALRASQSRVFLATLLLSLGVPMLVGGDELGRTQGGNNNAYCQDNPTSWFDWEHADGDLVTYTSGLIALRRAHPALRRRRYLTGATPSEVAWSTPSAVPMTGADWRDPRSRAAAMVFDGTAEPDRDQDGGFMVDEDLLVLVNGWWEPLDFTLPPPPERPGTPPAPWRVELDTFAGVVWPVDADLRPPGTTLTVGPRSLMLLAAPNGGGAPGRGAHQAPQAALSGRPRPR